MMIEADGDEPVRVALAWLVAAVKVGKAGEVLHAVRASERVLARPPSEVGRAPAIEALCVRYGYGVVMETVAALWAAQDPLGALTVGPCLGQRPAGEAGDGKVISLAARRYLRDDP